MNHSAPLVTYNNTLATKAGKNIKSCPSNPAEIAGSNFAEYWGTGKNPYESASASVQAIKDWYETEAVAYKAATHGYTKTPDTSTFGSWGHFSQMVWKSETQIGCYAVSCGPTTAFAKQFGSPDWSWAIVCASSPGE